MKLYGYFRSSAAYRVRIALNLKQIAVQQVSVHLVKDGGQQNHPEYLARNPLGLVPALELENGTVLTQSLAIIEYLDSLRPEPRLIPADPVAAAKVRAVALAIACDTHPLNNLRVLNYLKRPLGRSETEVRSWYRTWCIAGLEAVEQLLGDGPFCFGRTPSLADACLIPQLFNARRFEVSFAHLPRVCEVENTCEPIDAFVAAHPSRQPDAE
jgi:maleylacetoacetate isomerase